MTEAQTMLVLLDELGVHICPLVRAVVDMDAVGEVMKDGDAIALLRMCARSYSRLTSFVIVSHQDRLGSRPTGWLS